MEVLYGVYAHPRTLSKYLSYKSEQHELFWMQTQGKEVLNYLKN